MRKFLLLLFSFVLVTQAWAQDRNVTGKVTEGSQPIPGVNVVLKGTSVGTVTDADGNYSLGVPASGGTLIFSFIGYRTQEVAIGEQSTINVSLELETESLEEVIVTAQGVTRETKKLGYAATTISSGMLAEKPETDVGRALMGRTPGLQVQQSSGIAGSSSKINIRGFSSITGDTNPLWVVNGVPINTSANEVGADFRDGAISPTRFLDIDPNNIESITVLRGLQATITYGSQGRNGVILVTTKTGSSKARRAFEGSVSQSYFVSEAFVPEFQNKWANGFDGAYGEFFSNWGTLFDGKPTQVRHPYFEHAALFPEYPEFAVNGTTVQPGQTIPGYIPVAAPNNVKDFFNKGVQTTTSVSLSGGNENGNTAISYSRMDEKGFIPNNTLRRDNLSFGGMSKLTDKLTLNASFNFAKTQFQTPPTGAGTGSNSNGGPSIWANLFYTPRNIDLMGWPFEHPITKGNIYYRNGNDITNPRWVAANALQTDVTNRFFSNSALSYKVADWLNVTYRLGYDTYSQKQTNFANRDGGAGFAQALRPGFLRSINGTNTVVDHSFLVDVNKDITQDITMGVLAGYNYRQDDYVQNGLESLGQVIYGVIEHRNFTSTTSSDYRGGQLNFKNRQRWQGVFAEATFAYKEMVFVNLAGRQDWSSVLNKDFRSRFYPGASISFLPTAAFPNFASDVLDFLKFRFAYGTSANFSTPYPVSQVLALNGQAFTRLDGTTASTQALSNILANPSLGPELLQELEFGVESNLWDKRVMLNFTLYNRASTDQILNANLDPATGFTTTRVNAGNIRNKGIEGQATVVPVRNGDWTLSFTANYTKNISEVEALVVGVDEFQLAGFTGAGAVGNFAVVGRPMNAIKGTYAERSPDGQFIINSAGNYQIGADIAVIGDPNPQWMGSLMMELKWKAVSLTAQMDYVHGGQVFSYTAATMVGRGVSKDLEDFDPTLPLILPGVLEVFDGSGNVTGYTPNTIPLTTAGVFFGNTIIGGGPSDRGIFDATRARFREISLNYSLPKNLIENLRLKAVTISIQGNNLWFRAFNTPKYAKADLDRNAFGAVNGQGFDFLSGPAAKRYGANIRITF